MQNLLDIKVEEIFTKSRALNIGIIILSIIIAGKIYKSQEKTLASLKEIKDTEIKKNAILGDIDKLGKRLDVYRDFLNKKEVPLVINTIRNIAKEMDIEIVSLKPQPELSYGVYNKNIFEMSIHARGYHHLSKFISRIENFPDIYMIAETITLRPVSDSDAQQQNYKIDADLILSTVFLSG